ncbi:PAC2 family protein [Bifidobacterium sp. ESL0784]|uniref:PAC2 family protein n=1 Tax=Bifidobacterium sp. ESL0784 TaxID=2983231 RepID=UPI0023F80C6D|nr:PAC2 family protein [Bifidobacterium sp. ESL0784]MDF7641646.1 PAC2 family protein [Bifidobacterium sp. ESL0784]
MTTDAKTPKPIMVCAFEGWNDASQAATNVIRHLVATYESREIRHIRTDSYYDLQSARPMICHVTGQPRIIWPQTTFYEITIAPEIHVYAQIAPEPNYRWIDYCRNSLRIADELDVSEIVTLGSMFADCPHTRPLPVEESALRRGESSIRGGGVKDSQNHGKNDNPYDGPVGIPTVLDLLADQEGFNTNSMWVSVPQYLAGDECPQGTLQILQRLSQMLGVQLNDGTLPKQAVTWKAQADVLANCNDDLKHYIHHLEAKYDLDQQIDKLSNGVVPQGDQIAQEAEEFLSHIEN